MLFACAIKARISVQNKSAQQEIMFSGSEGEILDGSCHAEETPVEILFFTVARKVATGYQLPPEREE